MTISRKKHSTQTKVKVVLEVLKGEKTIAEITAKYGIHAQPKSTTGKKQS